MHIQFVNSTVDFVIYIANYSAVSHTWGRRESRRERESRQCVGSFKQKPLAKAMTSKRCSTGPSPLNRQNSGITEFTGVTQQTAALNNSAQRPEMTKNIESRCSMQSRNDIWSVLFRYITAGFVRNYPNKHSVHQGFISFHFHPSDRTNSESRAFFFPSVQAPN